MKNINWMINDRDIVVNYCGQIHTVSKTNSLSNYLINLIKENNLYKIPEIISFIENSFIPKELRNRIEEHIKDGLPYKNLLNFAKNLQDNPSFRVYNNLFSFLEKNNQFITKDGYFLAYKKVSPKLSDFDINQCTESAALQLGETRSDANRRVCNELRKVINHNQIDTNSIGSIVEVTRNQINDDPISRCSNALNVASLDYILIDNVVYNSDTRIIEVEVNPADVVSIPLIYYTQSMMRVCKYKVISVFDYNTSKVENFLTEEDIIDDEYEVLEDEYLEEIEW
jgi:hypothetical protein